MRDETPIMKAWREFAMADPENCDTEWATYLALVQKKETASISSPTNSTTPLHNRVHGPAVVSASTPTRSAASPRGLSSAVSTDDFHEPDAATFSPTSAPPTAAATSVRAATSTRVPAAAPLDSTPTSVLSSSTTTALTTTATSRAVPCTKHDLTPEARRMYDDLVGSSTPSSTTSDVSTVLLSHTEVEDVHAAVNINNTDIATLTPTAYSAEYPSHDVSVIVPEFMSPATPTSPMTTYEVIPKLAASVLSDEPLAIDTTSVSALPPTACSTNCPSSDFGMSFLASMVPHVTPSKPPPKAEATFRPAFTLQVQMSFLTSALATVGMDDNLAAEVFWVRNNSTNHVLIEALIVKQQEQILRPMLWPSFKYSSNRVYPQDPHSSTWQWEHMQQ